MRSPWLAGLVLTVLTGACARPATRAPAPSPSPAPTAASAASATLDTIFVPDTSTVLEVENNTTLDVRVFLLRGSMPFRLGTVLGKSTGQFPLRRDQIDSEIRFYASPVGASIRQTTDMLRIHPGQTVSWRLDDQLRSYRIAVY